MDDHEKAGMIAAQALEYGAALVKPGAVIRDILDKVEEFIKEKGALPAFPAQISINATAAHFCPEEDDDTQLKDLDLVKLDVGAHVNGFVGDNALTINLDKNNEEKNNLVEASRAARDAALAIIKAGVTPNEIGIVIHHEITKRGFQPIRNLSGHGVTQYQVHTSPSIPNFPNNDTSELQEGMTVAVEPFATTGKGTVYTASNPTLFSQIAKKPIRSPAARKVLKKIESYNGLPFTTRWLSREFGIPTTRIALQQLAQAGIIHEYPPLPESANGLVSQSEHTIRVEKEGCTILTSDAS